MRQVDDSNSIGPFLAFCGVAILLLICTLEVLRPNKLSIPIQIKNNKALCFFSKTCLKVDASNGVLITEGLKVNLRIINFHNLFDLKKDLERVSFYLLKKGNNNVDKNSVQIRPVIKYRGYTNSQEIAGSITGYFILPLKIPYDYEIFYKIDDAQPKSLSVMSTTRGTWFGKILPKLHKRLVTIFSKLSLLTSLLLFFVLAVSTFLEWRKNQVDDTTSNFFITSILRPVFLILFISINFLSIKILNKSFPQYEFGEIWSVGLLLLFVMPWGIWLPKDLKFQWIKSFFSTLFRSFPTYKNSSSHQNDLDDSCSLPPWLNNILSLFTALMILLFAYWMFLDNSFRWSLFEERDLLNTRDFLQTGRIPILGPQLLAGGQTPGGALYFLLAPLLLIQDDPITFSIFTKILYLFSALLIWLILRRFVSKLSALVGLILFCTSQNVMIYSYWPIHPSMSVFFYLFFVYAFSRGIVDQQRRWFIFSAFLLAILAQLHFSYVMLVVSLIMGIRAFKFFKRSFVFFLSVFAAFLLSFIPYLIVEITQGFPNFSLILSSPRFQPSYVAYSPFQNLAMVGESLAWIDR